MPLPDITFNFDTGSDTAASGAGPATAVTAATARTRAAGSLLIGLFDATDLSGVDTTGLHALRVNQASGRKTSKITAKKDTEQNTTGTSAVGSAVITAMGSTTGMSANDPIRVAGAGAAGVTLYSEILTVDSGVQVTLKDTASTVSTGGAVRDPRRVTIQDSLTITVDTLWAIGGRLKDISAATTQLWADLKAGWKVTFEYPASASPYTATAAIALNVAGDTTDGRIVIRGTGTSKPRLLGLNTSTDIFNAGGNLNTFKNLSFDQCTNAIDITAGVDVLVQDCDFNEILGITTGINVAVASRYVLSGCDFRGCTNGINITTGATLVIEGCYFACTTAGILSASNPTLMVRKNIFDGCPTGISLITSTTASMILIEENTFNQGTTGIGINHLARLQSMILRNNIFNGQTDGVAFPAGPTYVIPIVGYNWSFDVSNTYNPTIIEGNDGDLLLDPNFYDSAALEFRPQLQYGDTPFGGAWPQVIGSTPSESFSLPGAIQRKMPIFGETGAPAAIPARILSVEDDGTFVTLYVRYTNGSRAGQGDVITIPRNANAPPAGDPWEALARIVIQNFIKDGISPGVLLGEDLYF